MHGVSEIGFPVQGNFCLHANCAVHQNLTQFRRNSAFCALRANRFARKFAHLRRNFTQTNLRYLPQTGLRANVHIYATVANRFVRKFAHLRRNFMQTNLRYCRKPVCAQIAD